MKLTVIGLTNEVDKFSEKDLDNLKVFSGKNAGICYMNDSYFNSDVSDNEKAGKRFAKVIDTNHHSIADHVRVEVLFEGISKMLAILLNSLQDYSTSEKSGRYTVMTGNTEKEQALYKKWVELFEQRILELYPTIDDKWLSQRFNKKYPDNGYKIVGGKKLELEPKLDAGLDKEADIYFRETLLVSPNKLSRKLAQDYARYVLSVFSKSTTMGYSTNLRQWNYIYDWCLKYMNQYEEQTYPLDNPSRVIGLIKSSDNVSASYFEHELYKELKELSDFIKENLYVEGLRDSKNRCFEFLTQLSGDYEHPMSKYHVIEADMNMGRDESLFSEDDYLGVTYSVSYPASFIHLGQAERHRTLKYYMQFNPYCTYPEFFIPHFIRGTDLENEWLSDLDSVKDLIPQATMVGVIETGHISDFILKCQERLCGRANIEITEQTKKTAERFINEVNNGNPSKALIAYVNKIQQDSSLKTKCQLTGVCKEPCHWIKNDQVFTRLV